MNNLDGAILPHTPVTLCYGPVDVRAVAAEDIVASIRGQWTPCPGHNSEGEQCELSREPVVSAWSTRGWSQVLRVVRYPAAASLAAFRVTVEGGGIVDVAENHSLIRSDGGLVSPRDLVVGLEAGKPDTLLQAPMGTTVIAAQVSAFDLKNYTMRDDGLVEAADHAAAQLAVLRFGAMGHELVDAQECVAGHPAGALPDEMRCTCVMLRFAPAKEADAHTHVRGRGRVRTIERLHHREGGHTYALVTAEGVFAAGVGSLLVAG